MGEGSAVRAVVEVLARALTDRPDEVRVVESPHRGTTLVELFVAPASRNRHVPFVDSITPSGNQFVTSKFVPADT